ncbi:MAG TPA: cytochrome c oxidase subunit II [Terriglobales bacterium]|jgi:cytochrome c oxidase subunit 2|nr:cytochrome c oxidase subunit II [Terriglobales bacterium]
MFDNLPFWPTAASVHARYEDWLFIFCTVVSVVMTVLIFVVIAVFAMKYRRRHGREATQIEGSLLLETAWSVAPFGVMLLMFGGGAVLYFAMRTPPRDASQVYVVAKQWMWKLQHMEGPREINQLHVPVGRDVELIMTSQDVIHSFFVPEFRIKQDVIPGRYTTLWFRATKTGTYHLFCAQFCGTMHSGMIGEIIVMNPRDYQAWMTNGAPSGTLAQSGMTLFQQLGCDTCHNMQTQGRGPNLTGVFGKPVQLEDGRTVMADENYVRESILFPAAKVVSGFKPIMPSWQGQVTEDQLNELVAYVRSLNPAPEGAATTAGASGGNPPQTK